MFDFGPVLDAALGGALVAIGGEFERLEPKRLEALEGEQVMAVAQKGAQIAFDRARESIRVSLDKANRRLLGR